HRLVARIVERKRQSAADLVAHGARAADPAGLGETLQSRRDVDAVAENVVALGDDIAKVDADAELDAAVGIKPGIAVDHPALDLGGAAHRVDDAGEFGEEPIAGGLDDAPLMLADLRVDQLAAMRPEAVERLLFVRPDKARIADDI